MRPDPAAPLARAAARRHELTRSKAIQALRELDRSGHPVTFASVATAAGISRSWLYNQPDLRGEIERLRARHRVPATRPVPDRQRASDTSLLRRLEAATERNRQLEAENRELRQALALALGERRTPDLPGRPGDTPKKKSSGVLGPC